MEKKEEVVEWLKNSDVRFLIAIDERLYDYVLDNTNNPQNHNLYELLAVARFIRFFSTYRFSRAQYRKFVTFYESLEFKGNNGPERYVMTPVQCFQVANIYGFYNGSKRVCRNALLFVPRKFSKTTFVACVAIYDMLFGDYNAQAFCAANAYKQALICFDMIKYILKRLDPRSKSFRMVKETVSNRMKGRASKIEVVSNSPDKLDGLMCSTVIVDEYSQADDSGLYDVLTTSMGTRVNPLTIVITTASEKLDTPFVSMLNTYKMILKGLITDDHIFAHLFLPDEGDEDYGSPQLWHKVQPHLGITVQEDFYHDQWTKAQSSATDMRAFLTKLLNVFCNFGREWISSEAVKRVTEKVDIEKYRGCSAMCAIDLSVSDDFSAVCYKIYDSEARRFVTLVDYFIPRATMDRHPNSAFYKDMASKGYLHIIEGNVIDYSVLIAWIEKRRKVLNILQVGYDPYKSLEFVNTLTAMGAPMVPVRQSIASFTAPTEIVEKEIFDGRIILDDNPLNAYCFNNVTIVEDNTGNRKPMKKSENSKIDGVIVIIMCAYLFNNYRA